MLGVSLSADDVGGERSGIDNWRIEGVRAVILKAEEFP